MQNPESGGGGGSADNTVPIIDVSNASRKSGPRLFYYEEGNINPAYRNGHFAHT